MPDRTQTDLADPSTDSPWPHWADGRFYDQGFPWCVHADSHPGGMADDYPDPGHPADECVTGGGLFDGARDGVNGAPLALSVYGSHPFRFGADHFHPADETRVVIEYGGLRDDDPQTRISLPASEALNLARHLVHTVDVVNYRARPVTR